MLDYFHTGKRVREYLGIHILPGDAKGREKKQLSETIRAQREIELQNNSLGFIAPHKKHEDFFTYFDSFIKKTSRKDPRLFKACLKKLRQYHKGKTLSASLIDTKFCQGFRNELVKNLSGESPSNYFTVFIRVLNEAVRDKIYSSSPAIGVKNTKPKNDILSKEVLSDDELKSLFQTSCGNDVVKRAFLFSCFTGLRGGDVRELIWKNIDLKNKQFRFSQNKTQGRMLPPLSDTAIFLLGEEGEPTEKVFPLPTNDGMNRKSLKTWVKNAGIKKHITFHCARHTFATSLLVHGADLKTTSLLLGHSSTRETEKYTHISEQMKRKAVNNLPSLI